MLLLSTLFRRIFKDLEQKLGGKQLILARLANSLGVSQAEAMGGPMFCVWSLDLTRRWSHAAYSIEESGHISYLFLFILSSSWLSLPFFGPGYVC